MLQTIHDKAKGWIAYVIIFLISIPFALWGVHEYLGGGEERLVAKVNGEAIPAQVYQNELQQRREQLRAMFGGQLPNGFLDNPTIKTGIVDSLVQQEILRQAAEAQNFEIDERSLIEKIKSFQAFKVDGEFSLERYKQLLAQQRRGEAAFENQLRLAMVQDQYRLGVANSGFLPTATVEAYERLMKQQRELSIVEFSAAKIRDALLIDDAALQGYFEENKALFKTDERLKLAYLELSQAALEAQFEPSEDEVREFYELEADRYRDPEERRGRQILVKLPEDASEAQLDEAREKANQLHERLLAGEAFADLAKAETEDEFARESGGDLGFVIKGDLEPIFEDRLFAMAQGEYSEPLETPFGISLIYVEEIRAGEYQDFDTVKDTIGKDLRQREAERLFVEYSEQLMTLAYEQPDSLEAAADATGLSIQETDWLTRIEGQGIAANSAVRATAFSPELLDEGNNSELLELDQNRVAVVRVIAHELPAEQAFAAVRDEVLALYQRDESEKQAEALAENLLQDVKQMQTWPEILPASAISKDLGFVERSSTEVSPSVLEAAFKMAQPEAGMKTYTKVIAANGDRVVIAFSEIKEADIVNADLDIAARKATTAYSAREFDAFYNAMEARAEVKVFSENLDL